MVEHNMSVVSGICDKISVLQRGAMLAEGTYAEVSKNPKVMEAYMGSTSGEWKERTHECFNESSRNKPSAGDFASASLVW
jgi:ABC-type methionine transport system ATPase subunit